jgi:hypothetical protein
MLVLVELLSSTFWMDTMPINSCRWLFLITGIGIGVFLLFRPFSSHNHTGKVIRWIPYIFLLILFAWIIPQYSVLFSEHALDYTQADMLPVIQVMCRRWLDHMPVYATIPEYWHGTFPVYLPAMWMPFIPAVLLSIDPRWITLILVGSGIILTVLSRRCVPFGLLFFLLIGLWFDYLMHNRDETFRLSQEGVVYFYLILLVVALYFQKARWIGIAMGLCLLSRYSILFFVIAFLYWIWRYRDWNWGRRLLSGLAITMLFLMTLGGAWANIRNFIILPNQYLDNIHMYPAKYQAVLDDGLGLVPLCGIQSIPWIARILPWVLIGLNGIMIRYYHKDRHPFYVLGFLKLNLVIFYNLMIVPYQYLMYSSVIVSLVLFYFYSNLGEQTNINLVQ